MKHTLGKLVEQKIDATPPTMQPRRVCVVAPSVKSMFLYSTRGEISRLSHINSSVNPAAATAASTILSDSPAGAGIRKRPWEQEILKSWAARKQVRVNLDAVLDVSTGKRPWRSSFGEANPEVQPGAEPEFARPACNSYVSDAERRKKAEGQLQSAKYLHRELPVRLAYAVTELDKVSWLLEEAVWLPCWWR